MKTKVLVLFGGVSSEYEVSLVSAKSVISNMPKDKYDVVMMGITRDGLFRLYKGSPDLLPGDKWLADAGNLEPAPMWAATPFPAPYAWTRPLPTPCWTSTACHRRNGLR